MDGVSVFGEEKDTSPAPTPTEYDLTLPPLEMFDSINRPFARGSNSFFRVCRELNQGSVCRRDNLDYRADQRIYVQYLCSDRVTYIIMLPLELCISINSIARGEFYSSPENAGKRTQVLRTTA